MKLYGDTDMETMQRRLADYFASAFVRYKHRKMWKSPYFWHDAIGIYFNRWIKCPLFGHRNVKDLWEENCRYCFDCGTRLPKALKVEVAVAEDDDACM